MSEMKERVIGDFYENADCVEHGCCWETTICFKTDKGEGMYGCDEYMLLECDKDYVEFILTALNRKST